MAIATWWARRKQVKKAHTAYVKAEANDPAWDNIVDQAKQVFSDFQYDWSDFNETNMATYLTPHYQAHIRLVLRALQQLNRQNKMADIHIDSAVIFNISDQAVNANDNFDIEFRASVSDQLIDTSDGSVIFTNPSTIKEVWHFVRSDAKWLLDSIAQLDAESLIEKGYSAQTVLGDADKPAVRILNFANQNNFFYNADFGWMLLPRRGSLFGAASFGHSDINYHVIGEYHNVLVQFYQYVPIPKNEHKISDYFAWFYRPGYVTQACTIAQTTLPKTYGNIVVRQRGAFDALALTPSGMQRVTLEGVDFDKRFLVYTTDFDQVSSLELLNPAFMEKLLAAPYEINIEIVDNSLYLYSPDDNADYGEMLTMLQSAFEEMKL